LRGRVIGSPEISTDGLHYYRPAIRDAFGKRASHGVINKTYSVTHLNVTEASRRYSPASVIAVERLAVAGEPEQISTSYVERSNLTLPMASKRFARLSNGFSKKIDCHLAAVGLYVAFYNLCRTHEALRMTPAMALGITDHSVSTPISLSHLSRFVESRCRSGRSGTSQLVPLSLINSFV
jgi:hypothetical protein